VTNSSITGNKADNLHVNIATPLTQLQGSVSATNLSGAAGTNAAFDQVSGSTEYNALDLGGGQLGSAGNNCIVGGGQADAESTGYTVNALHNWWGGPTGPGTGRVLAVNGAINTTPFLTTKPSTC
jgi:hypothetical protein